MGQVHEGSLSAFRLVKPMQMQWHHWLQVLQQTIASVLPLRLQCSCGQISLILPSVSSLLVLKVLQNIHRVMMKYRIHSVYVLYSTYQNITYQDHIT